jgi:hypothetical protein
MIIYGTEEVENRLVLNGNFEAIFTRSLSEEFESKHIADLII